MLYIMNKTVCLSSCIAIIVIKSGNKLEDNDLYTTL